jgi:flagellar basal-body rod protein FlgF
MNVLGDGGGPLALPPDTEVTIARDGTISAIPTTGNSNAVAVIGRLKLVNPPEAELMKSADGLFRLRSGQPAETDPNVTVQPGALEGSNVNAVESLVGMIEHARQFEMHMRLIKTADSDAQQAQRILNLNA